jgi:hypothetical protein
MPRAPYILTSDEKVSVVDIIKRLKTPSKYVGAIHKCLEEGKLRYMKSHDFHVLMHQVRNQHIPFLCCTVQRMIKLSTWIMNFKLFQ